MIKIFNFIWSDIFFSNSYIYKSNFHSINWKFNTLPFISKFILWTNSYASNINGCICPKCNTNLPWCLKTESGSLWFIFSISIQNLQPNAQLGVPSTNFSSIHPIHYQLILFDQPIMFFLSPPPILILLVCALKLIPSLESLPCLIQP